MARYTIEMNESEAIITVKELPFSIWRDISRLASSSSKTESNEYQFKIDFSNVSKAVKILDGWL